MTELERAIENIVKSKVDQAVEQAMSTYVAPVEELPTVSAYEAYEMITGHPGKPPAVSKFLGGLVRKKKLRKIVVSSRQSRYWREDILNYLEEQTVTGRHV